jgi:hypothetical protein
METVNKLQMAQLYQSLGEEGKVREILQSLQNGVNTLEVLMLSEEEGNESDKEATNTITSTSNTTMMSHESNDK